MSHSQLTRFVRLRADVEREGATNEGTRCVPLRALLVNHRALFNHHQRRLHQLLGSYGAPGVAIFALHPTAGIAGHCWLAATSELRAGTIGRHSQADLYLTDDEGLSLRHLLVMVRQTAAGLSLRVADLATPGGFQAEEGGVLRAVESDGALVLRAASYSLLMLPTGGPAPWNPEHADPWLALPARVLVAHEKEARTQPPRSAIPGAKKHRIGMPGLPEWPRSEERPADPEERRAITHITVRQGPAEPGPEPLLHLGEPVAGHLFLTGRSEERLSVGPRALERGIILGRYSRCTGTSADHGDRISRVHAVLLHSDGEVHLIDAGSTNGVYLGERELHCAAVEPGAEYCLGEGVIRLRWEPAQ